MTKEELMKLVKKDPIIADCLLRLLLSLRGQQVPVPTETESNE